MDFATMSTDQIRTRRENVLLRLLLRVTQIETDDLAERLRRLGHPAVAPSHIRLLGNVDTEGTRLIVLAGRIGTTRQAVSQLAAELERRGYLERIPDQGDRRATLVRHTAQGRGLLNTALTEMSDIEAGYEHIIGPDAMRSLKESLQAIAAAADPASRLGR
ncbi:hypothetical protein NS506_07579 [Nocardia seriolae]|uniref:MarR family transcriptional regulator n=3 Tax=Nocardia seriolae TaxID=37332 RepID=A0ABC9Z5X8_9NOCA|nr:MarR family transcriptional regulator [Nocardia seriolae]APB01599.1 hypothetical protein NS506_07579 [Nocardia seriolae]OJF78332.1 hypothetical protein NS14008_02760 [Nocardia seriolae]BAW04235.1 conserved hypothetical protein [Nocardia seriolae]BEK91186.1 hypothetical protein NSERKGN1266_71370 [Nocardia seriolae]BEK93093.1 hypothetical protein NSER024013_09990 [Nocardia seriolae]